MNNPEPEENRRSKAALAGLLFWILADVQRSLFFFTGLSAFIVGIWVLATSSGSSRLFSRLRWGAREGSEFSRRADEKTGESGRPRRSGSGGGGALGDGLLGVLAIAGNRPLQDQFGKKGPMAQNPGGGLRSGDSKGSGQNVPTEGKMTPGGAEGEGAGKESQETAGGLGGGAGKGGKEGDGNGAAKAGGDACDTKNPVEPMTSNGLCPPSFYKAPSRRLCYACRNLCVKRENAECPLSSDSLADYSTQLLEDKIAKKEREAGVEGTGSCPVPYQDLPTNLPVNLPTTLKIDKFTSIHKVNGTVHLSKFGVIQGYDSCSQTCVPPPCHPDPNCVAEIDAEAKRYQEIHQLEGMGNDETTMGKELRNDKTNANNAEQNARNAETNQRNAARNRACREGTNGDRGAGTIGDGGAVPIGPALPTGQSGPKDTPPPPNPSR